VRSSSTPGGLQDLEDRIIGQKRRPRGRLWFAVVPITACSTVVGIGLRVNATPTRFALGLRVCGNRCPWVSFYLDLRG